MQQQWRGRVVSPGPGRCGREYSTAGRNTVAQPVKSWTRKRGGHGQCGEEGYIVCCGRPAQPRGSHAPDAVCRCPGGGPPADGVREPDARQIERHGRMGQQNHYNAATTAAALATGGRTMASTCSTPSTTPPPTLAAAATAATPTPSHV